MPGLNLKHVEAKERATLVKVESYDIDLDLTSSTETFTSSTTIKFTGLKPGTSTFIDAVGKSVISATLNGTPLDTSDFDGESIFLPAIAASNELKLVIEAIYSKSGEGLHRFVDPADSEVYLYTQHETHDARRTFACFDQPDLKATFAGPVLSLKANTIGDPNPYWYTPSGGPGSTGNKIMDASFMLYSVRMF